MAIRFSFVLLYLCIVYVIARQQCTNMNLCCQSQDKTNQRWLCTEDCSCITISRNMVASLSEGIFFDIPSGVRNFHILDDLKVHVLVASKQQLTRTICSVGVIDIRWHNDTVVCVPSTTSTTTSIPVKPEKTDGQQFSSAEKSQTPSTALLLSTTPPVTQDKHQTTVTVPSETSRPSDSEPSTPSWNTTISVEAETTGQEKSTSAEKTQSIITTKPLPTIHTESLPVTPVKPKSANTGTSESSDPPTSVIIGATTAGIAIIVVIIIAVIYIIKNRNRETIPTETELVPIGASSPYNTQNVTLTSFTSSDPSSPTILIHTPPDTSASSNGDEPIPQRQRSPIVTRSVTAARQLVFDQ